MKHLLVLFIMVSCGKIIVDTNIPDNITFGPDFQKAIEFCDNRYGINSEESEECFNDYRLFLSPRIQLDLASINTFCKGRYTTEEEIAACENDLLNIINNAATPNN